MSITIGSKVTNLYDQHFLASEDGKGEKDCFLKGSWLGKASLRLFSSSFHHPVIQSLTGTSNNQYLAMPQLLDRPAVLSMLHQSPVAVRKDDVSAADLNSLTAITVLLNGGVG
jgi:hypothetical protein